MKCVILLALLAVVYAQRHPNFDSNNPLHHLIEAEVHHLIHANDGISAADCTAKCDAMFDLAAGHDEQITDHLCAEECQHQVHMRDGRTHPTHRTHPTQPAA